MKDKKWGHPLSWFVIADSDSASVYKVVYSLN